MDLQVFEDFWPIFSVHPKTGSTKNGDANLQSTISKNGNAYHKCISSKNNPNTGAAHSSVLPLFEIFFWDLRSPSFEQKVSLLTCRAIRTQTQKEGTSLKSIFKDLSI